MLLMDTIIADVPMPKIYVHAKIQNKQTYRIVIDGQQRLTAIFGFLDDEYKLGKPYAGPYEGKLFSELPPEVQTKFLEYKIDINGISNVTDEQLREIYLRVNKYNVSLNKQELRKADFPGDFLDTAETLAQLKFFEQSKIFTAASLRRYGDVEYVSELLALLLDGIQDKKTKLDDFYSDHQSWASNCLLYTSPSPRD